MPYRAVSMTSDNSTQITFDDIVAFTDMCEHTFKPTARIIKFKEIDSGLKDDDVRRAVNYAKKRREQFITKKW